MMLLKNFIIMSVLMIISATNAARIVRQVPISNDLSQFGLFVDDDQIVRRNPGFIPNLPITQTTMATTETPPQSPTTASPEFLACMERCRTTQEYNPVCGTDMINYRNAGNLACAQNCGKNVQRIRLGTCLPL